MTDLTPRERELVALGAAMGSNCVPCVEYHVPEARKAGLSDREILAAVRLADKVRQVPARKTLQAALKQLPTAAETGDAGHASGCGADGPAAKPETGRESPAADPMAAVMAKMMGACGHGAAAERPQAAAETRPNQPAANDGCGCG